MLWREVERFEKIPDPWKEFERLNRIMSDFPRSHECEFPPLNVWLNSDGAIVAAEIPGIEPSVVDISVAGKMLTVKGSRNAEPLKDGETIVLRERWTGKFSKTVSLPFNIEADKVHARYGEGILYINLPRAEAEKPKKIEIEYDRR